MGSSMIDGTPANQSTCACATEWDRSYGEETVDKMSPLQRGFVQAELSSLSQPVVRDGNSHPIPTCFDD